MLEFTGISFNTLITRPNNTTAYGAGTVIGPSTTATAAQQLKFSLGGVAWSGAEVMITTTDLELDIAAIISGMTSFNLALYNAAPPSALADGATWDVPSGDRGFYLGTIGLGTPVDLGSTLAISSNGINQQLTIPSPGVLWAYLVTVGGYTPAASSVFRVRAHGIRL